MNRAVGLYNTLGIYARRGDLDRDLVLQHWGGPIKNQWKTLEMYLRWRRQDSGYPTMWSYLVWLGQEADADVSDDLRLQKGWDKLPL